MRMKDNKYFELLRHRNRNRFWITIFTIILFLGIVFGVLYALIVGTTIAAAWKEILLLLLGAFIGAYSRTIDFWFNDSEKDIELMRHSIKSDDIKYNIEARNRNIKNTNFDDDKYTPQNEIES